MNNTNRDKSNPGWADKPEVQRLIRRALYVVCGLLFVTDFLVHRHISTDLERIPAFYALYGFVALVAVVLAAKGLRRLVMRDEDYYDQ